MNDDPELTALYNAGMNVGNVLVALAIGMLAAAVLFVVLVLS